MRWLALAVVLVSLPASAQTGPVAADSSVVLDRREIRRDGDRALVLNVFVPGLGHMVVGDTGRGAALLALGVGVPIAAGLATGVSSFSCESGRGCDDLDGSAGVFLAAVAVGAGAWVYGLVDSDDAAERVARRRLTVGPAAVVAGGSPRAGLAVRVGL